MSSLASLDQDSQRVRSPDGPNQPRDPLWDIVNAAGVHVPLITPERLSFDKALGKGTTFEVDLAELHPQDEGMSSYLVAVKYVIRRPLDHENESELRCSRELNVAREIRVLTHPTLRASASILTILGYGWKPEPNFGSVAYVVVEYSEHGTLADYLKRCGRRLARRQQKNIALDVAMGLNDLHRWKIIHGDLKLANVLVFDAQQADRQQMAKLADFGSAILEGGPLGQAAYCGTPLFNAPEVRGVCRYSSLHPGDLTHFYRADIWSLGLVIWEVMQRGRSYINPTWLEQDETPLRFIDRVAAEETNGILRRAQEYCKAMAASPVKRVISKALEGTLRDDPGERSTSDRVVRDLAGGME